MGQEERGLMIRYSAAALDTLDEIWDWNKDQYGAGHATQYIDFLRAQIGRLAIGTVAGRPVPGRPGLLYLTIRRRRQGHGHVTVYKTNEQGILVHSSFHTAQDWREKL